MLLYVIDVVKVTRDPYPILNAPMPYINVKIWDKNSQGYCPTEDARSAFKEQMSEWVDVFVSDLAKQNSDEMRKWMKRRGAAFDSLVVDDIRSGGRK
jgi:hypothetical protein